MWSYIVIAVIWVAFLVPAIKERLASEIYAHVGTATFFTLLVLSLGKPQIGDISNILWLKIIGFVLFVPAAILLASSFITLKRKGNAKTLAPSDPITLVDTGIYGIVRHPMHLGTAVFSIALILVFQSILAIVLGSIAVSFLWMACKGEDKFSIKKFGESYREYMVRVPRWNALRGLIASRRQ